jgi:hypothetical protein
MPSPDSMNKTPPRREFALVPMTACDGHHRILGAVQTMLTDGLPYMPLAAGQPAVVAFEKQCARLADDTTASDDLRRAAISVMSHALDSLRNPTDEGQGSR